MVLLEAPRPVGPEPDRVMADLVEERSHRCGRASRHEGVAEYDAGLPLEGGAVHTEVRAGGGGVEGGAAWAYNVYNYIMYERRRSYII